MRKLAVVGAFSVALTFPLFAEQGAQSTEASNMGFHGPVRTQRATSRKLNPDPRHDGKIFVFSPTAWFVFDRTGKVIEQPSAATTDGRIIGIQRILRNANGDTTTMNALGTTVTHNETKLGPHGPVEESSFQNGVLILRETHTYDTDGTLVESDTYGADGRLASVERHGNDNTIMMASRVSDQSNELDFQMIDHYSDDGDLVERDYLDGNGKLLTSFSLRLGILTSYWQKPKCECTNHSVGISLDDVSYDYVTTPDGSLETTVDHHPGTRSNLEPTETERFGENNILLEKLTFAYERDSYGNWTKRVVSAWDPKTGAMVPIEEDTRTLTYY